METKQSRVKVLIVDDSSTFRWYLQKLFEKDERFMVIGLAWNGKKALSFMERQTPDLVTLDIEMPEMDGMETLAEIVKLNSHRAEDQKIQVVMLSSHVGGGADFAVRSLDMGAFDAVGKPDPQIGYSNEQFEADFKKKLDAFIESRLPHQEVQPPLAREVRTTTTRKAKRSFQGILIGASTGGPKALSELLPKLTQVTHLPIFITLHFPAFFIENLARSLEKKCHRSVVVPDGTELICQDRVYLASGGSHMVIRISTDRECVGCAEQPPFEGCRPSVNMLFHSAALELGRVIAIVLTGMGNDGSKSLAHLKRSGSFIIAQDERTSVVWGMPGCAVKTGLVDEVVALDKIAAVVERLLADEAAGAKGT